MFYTNRSIKSSKENYLITLYKELLKRNGEINLYVHFPFCDSFCVYCPFIKDILQNNNKRDEVLKNYIAELKEHIIKKANDLYQFWLNRNFFKIKTIAFGGWTPSLIPNHYLIEIIEVLNKYFGDFTHLEEFTIEINPNEENFLNVLGLKPYGLNRISLWIQTFDEKITEITGRWLKNQGAYEVIQETKKEFENYNIDMMYNLPFFNRKMLERDIQKIKEILPPHISYYPLYVFPKTPLSTIELKEGLSNYDKKTGLYWYKTLQSDFSLLKKELSSVWYNFYTMDYLSLDNKYHHRYQERFLNNEILISFWPKSYNSSEYSFSLNWERFLKEETNTYFLYSNFYKEIKNLFQSIRLNKKIYSSEKIIEEIKKNKSLKSQEVNNFLHFLDDMDKYYFTWKQQDLQYYLSSLLLSLLKKLDFSD